MMCGWEMLEAIPTPDSIKLSILIVIEISGTSLGMKSVKEAY